MYASDRVKKLFHLLVERGRFIEAEHLLSYMQAGYSIYRPLFLDLAKKLIPIDSVRAVEIYLQHKKDYDTSFLHLLILHSLVNTPPDDLNTASRLVHRCMDDWQRSDLQIGIIEAGKDGDFEWLIKLFTSFHGYNHEVLVSLVFELLLRSQVPKALYLTIRIHDSTIKEKCYLWALAKTLQMEKFHLLPQILDSLQNCHKFSFYRCTEYLSPKELKQRKLDIIKYISKIALYSPEKRQQAIHYIISQLPEFGGLGKMYPVIVMPEL